MDEVEHRLFQYDPIESAEIRLVQFSETENGLSGRFETFSLEDGSRLVPAYKALSYVWSLDGNKPTSSWSISVDKKALLVLDSLRPFFEVLKAKTNFLDGTWWWIDSMSVNQNDFPEKGNQVRIMNKIYHEAEETVVWLGERSDNSDDAMEFIAFLHGLGPIRLPYPELPSDITQPSFAPKWTALENILERKWWTRIWTIQEYILSKHVSLWCGNGIVSREAFSHALFLLNRPHNRDVPDSQAFANGWNRRRVQMWHTLKSGSEFGSRAEMSLVALAAYCSNCDATDDRDRLYAIRAIATDYKLLEVDYTLSTEDVYLSFAQSFISYHRSLDIICFAHTYRQFEGSPLPSWVPDWRRKAYPLVVPQMVSQSSRTEIGNLRPPRSIKLPGTTVEYFASGRRPAVFEFTKRTLVVQGIVLDVVDGLGASGNSEIVQSSAPIPSSQEASHKVGSFAQDSLKGICNCIVLGRKDRYLQDPVPRTDFMRNFWALCSDVRSNVDAEVHPSFVDWFNRNRQLLIRGETLDSIIAQSSLSDDSSKPQGLVSSDGPSIQIQDSFLGRFYDTVIRMSRRLLIGQAGILGMAPERAKKGDFICILKGCSVPVVLRRTADVSSYLFVGECFIDGYMSGEAFDNPKLCERSISIC